MKRAWGNTIDRILFLLQDDPLTKHEICERLGLTHDQVASVLSRLRKKTRDFDQRIYISGYARNVRGKRTYIRAQYSLGNKNDAAKPAPYTAQERSLKSSRLRMVKLRNSSIFTMALPKKELLRKHHEQI